MDLNETLSRYCRRFLFVGIPLLLLIQASKAWGQTCDTVRVTVVRRLANRADTIAFAACSIPTSPLPPVNQPPVPAIGASCVVGPTGPTGDYRCTFSGVGSTDDHGIASYTWSGTGQPAKTGVQVIYGLRAGLYTIRLTVADSAGLSAFAEQQLVVGSTPPQPPDTTIPPPPPSTGAFAQLGKAAPPRVRLDPTRPAGPFMLVNVQTCAELQAAINAAARQTEILYAPGLTCTQTLTIPPKAGAGWVIVRQAGYTHIPGVRLRPTVAAALPFTKHLAPNNGAPAVQVQCGAQRYRFEGGEFGVSAGVTQLVTLMAVGSYSPAACDDTIEDIQFFGVYVTGGPTAQVRHCFMAHARRFILEDSWVELCKWKGTDAQAVLAYNTRGPLRIVNNYLEGSGQSLFLGGEPPAIPGAIVAEDVEAGRNHLAANPAWCPAPTALATVKTRFESKGSGRVYLYESVLDGNCRDGQEGGPINIKTSCIGCSTHDVTIVDVLVRNVGEWGSISRSEGLAPDSATRRITIARVAFEAAWAQSPWAGSGRGLRLEAVGGGVSDVDILDSRWVDHTGNAYNAIAISGIVNNLTVRNVAMFKGIYGLKLDGGGEGQSAWAAGTSGVSSWSNVTVVGPVTVPYPAGTTFVPSVAATGTVGLDLAALKAKLAGVVVPR